MGIVASLTLRRDNNARYVVACRALVCDEARFAQEGSDPRDLPHWSVAGQGVPLCLFEMSDTNSPLEQAHSFTSIRYGFMSFQYATGILLGLTVGSLRYFLETFRC